MNEYEKPMSMKNQQTILSLCLAVLMVIACEDGLKRGNSPEILISPAVGIFPSPNLGETGSRLRLEVSNTGGADLMIASVQLREEDDTEEISLLDAQDWESGEVIIAPGVSKNIFLSWVILDAQADVATLTFDTNAGTAQATVETPDLDPTLQVEITPGGVQPESGGRVEIQDVIPGGRKTIKIQLRNTGFVPLSLERLCFASSEETCLDGQEGGGGHFRLCDGVNAHLECPPPELPNETLIRDTTYTFSVLYHPSIDLIDTVGAQLLVMSDAGQTPRYLIQLLGSACFRTEEGDVCGRCGDGIIDAEEECDDANLIDTDLCLTSCQIAPARCGDGVVQSDVEECDDGDQDDTNECNNRCELVRCGDGPNQTSAEDCDDQNPCTSDRCEMESGLCVHEVSDGAVCVPTTGCVDVGACVAGDCVPVEGAHCDDENPCTADSCDEETNTCTHEATSELEGVNCGEDLNDRCTQNLCTAGECLPETRTCVDDDPCTTDHCDPEVGCYFSPSHELDGCAPEVISCQAEVEVNSGSSSCCFNDTHTLDLAQVIEADTEVSCCIRPGLNCGCRGTATYDVSIDGQTWTEVKVFETISSTVEMLGPNQCDTRTPWIDHCEVFTPQESFRFIRGSHDNCYADFFRCTVSSAENSCEDDNRCTTDRCADDDGRCIHEPVNDPTCLRLQNGSDLIAFHALPENPTIENVFGDLAGRIDWIWSEGLLAMPLPSTGEFIGNLKYLERQRSYWIHMDLPSPLFLRQNGREAATAIPLDGVPTAPDLIYTLHEGDNMISFAGGVATPVAEALADEIEHLISQIQGAGMATFAMNGSWVGNLSQFKPNRGYEMFLSTSIEDFQYISPATESSVYTYGCAHPSALNYDIQVTIDNGGCIFDLPEGWTQPSWAGLQAGELRSQAFVIFMNPTIGGQPLESGDAIAAFAEGQQVGLGFSNGDHATVAILNVDEGTPLAFAMYDQSTHSTIPINTNPPVTWTMNGKTIAGCMEVAASNYIPDATVDFGSCVP